MHACIQSPPENTPVNEYIDNNKKAPQKGKILNDINTNKSEFAECFSHPPENPHDINEFCAKMEILYITIDFTSLYSSTTYS